MKPRMTVVIPEVGEVRVVEGVSGYWHYHLAKLEEYTAICGRTGMMDTNSSIDQFGVVPKGYHIPLSYCAECLRQLKPNCAMNMA